MANKFRHFVEKNPVPGRCEQMVNKMPGERIATFGQCSRKSVVVCEGHHYCKLHDPVAVAERDAAQRAKWAAEREETTSRWRQERLLREKGEKYDALRSQLVAVAKELKAVIQGEGGRVAVSPSLQSLPDDIKQEIGL